MRYPPLRYYRDTVSKRYCAIWGGISHWATKKTPQREGPGSVDPRFPAGLLAFSVQGVLEFAACHDSGINFPANLPGTCLDPKGPKIELIQSRLKFSISLDFNLTCIIRYARCNTLLQVTQGSHHYFGFLVPWHFA